jgi:dolichol-phosphate mannosyltransferase
LLSSENTKSKARIAVIIPCYKCESQIMNVLQDIPAFVDDIFIVDDACPNLTGQKAQSKNSDARVHFIFHAQNQGVGGAVLTGYKAALLAQADIMIKIDGDGQMDQRSMLRFIEPIISGRADYTKGNRFFSPESVKDMPRLRIFGNGILSFFTKISSGYWNIFDPTNGYTAIHSAVVQLLPYDKISRRYFFESELLCRLNLLNAKVIDVPIPSRYADEVSGLKEFRIVPEFLYKHFKFTFKRLFYKYFLYDFNLASIQLIVGPILFLFGFIFGIISWVESVQSGTYSSPGTVMLAALPIMLGFQMILSAIHFDMISVPTHAIHDRLELKDLK